MSISLVGMELAFCLSFISSSSPPPKFVFLEEEPMPSKLSKSNEISIISLSIIMMYIEQLILSNTNRNIYYFLINCINCNLIINPSYKIIFCVAKTCFIYHIPCKKQSDKSSFF